MRMRVDQARQTGLRPEIDKPARLVPAGADRFDPFADNRNRLSIKRLVGKAVYE